MDGWFFKIKISYLSFCKVSLQNSNYTEVKFIFEGFLLNCEVRRIGDNTISVLIYFLKNFVTYFKFQIEILLGVTEFLLEVDINAFCKNKNKVSPREVFHLKKISWKYILYEQYKQKFGERHIKIFY